MWLVLKQKDARVTTNGFALRHFSITGYLKAAPGRVLPLVSLLRLGFGTKKTYNQLSLFALTSNHILIHLMRHVYDHLY